MRIGKDGMYFLIAFKSEDGLCCVINNKRFITRRVFMSHDRL